MTSSGHKGTKIVEICRTDNVRPANRFVVAALCGRQLVNADVTKNISINAYLNVSNMLVKNYGIFLRGERRFTKWLRFW